MTAGRLTPRQEATLAVLRAARTPNTHRLYGLDCAELAEALDTSPEGAAASASSLVRRGLALRFVGGIGRQRVHYQAT